MRSHRGALSLLLVLGLAQSLEAFAGGNLLANAGFDSDLGGWTDNFSRWSHRADEGFASGPGSAECSASGSICQLTQCVETPGEFASVIMSAAFRNLGGSDTSSFSVTVTGFGGAACTSSNLESGVVTETGVGSGAWIPVAGHFVPTAPTASVRFGINCGGATLQRCLADDAYVAPSLVLFADGFESALP